MPCSSADYMSSLAGHSDGLQWRNKARSLHKSVLSVQGRKLHRDQPSTPQQLLSLCADISTQPSSTMFLYTYFCSWLYVWAATADVLLLNIYCLCYICYIVCNMKSALIWAFSNIPWEWLLIEMNTQLSYPVFKSNTIFIKTACKDAWTYCVSTYIDNGERDTKTQCNS